ncbi:unnamed protein product [Discosporangium mesarthrocarpum]
MCVDILMCRLQIRVSHLVITVKWDKWHCGRVHEPPMFCEDCRELFVMSQIFIGYVKCAFTQFSWSTALPYPVGKQVGPYGTLQPREKRLQLMCTIIQEFVSKTNWESGPYASIRNLVVGPLTEELVFRGCSLPLLVGAGIGRADIIWGSPLIFGIAHLHHAYEWLRQGHGLASVAMAVAFQMMYTSIFGAYAVFIHLRTGNLISSVLVHAFCNLMGVPDLTFHVAPGNVHHSSPTSALHSRRKWVWCSYVLGIVLFLHLLIPLTSPSIYGGSILWSLHEPTHV